MDAAAGAIGGENCRAWSQSSRTAGALRAVRYFESHIWTMRLTVLGRDFEVQVRMKFKKCERLVGRCRQLQGSFSER